MEKLITVAVIGAGVVGSLIAREFTKYNATVHLFEKEEDVGWGITKSNSAILHGGYDDAPDSIRAKFCAKGNQMYSRLAEELHFAVERIGSFVLAKQAKEIPYLETLFKQAKENGLQGCEILPKDRVLEKEPNANPNIVAGFWCPQAGITEPWMVAISAVENAVANGLILHLAEEVVGFETQHIDNKNKIKVLKTVNRLGVALRYEVDVVVNAAGLWADKIAQKAQAFCPPLHPRRGEYLLLDKFIPPLVNTVLFPIPTAISKGILVLPTVDGGMILGPTAFDLPIDQKDQTQTTAAGLAEVLSCAKELLPCLDGQWTVKSFAGLRPESPQKDFVVGSTQTTGFLNAAAMRSPGLTAAPAVAAYLVEETVIRELQIPLQKKTHFNPFNPPYTNAASLPLSEWEKQIAEDRLYGKMACVCNKVTEGDIRDAITRGASTVDGVKFRTRATFGRCQGGFCINKIVELLARQLGKPFTEIKMRSGNTELVQGKVRQ